MRNSAANQAFNAFLTVVALIGAGPNAGACEPPPPATAPRALIDLVTVARAAVEASSRFGPDRNDRFDACVAKLKAMADGGKLFVEEPPSERPTIAALNDLLRNGVALSREHHHSEGGTGPYEQLSRTVTLAPAATAIPGAPHAVVEHLVGTWNSGGADSLYLTIDGFLVASDGRPFAEVNQSLSVATSDCLPSYTRTLVSHLSYGPGDAATVYTTQYSFNGESNHNAPFKTTAAGARAMVSGLAESAYGGLIKPLDTDKWKQSELETRDIFSLDSQAAVSGFRHEDFLTSRLGIGFNTTKAPSFDNFSAYGELRSAPTTDGQFANRFISERDPDPKKLIELKPGEREANLKETAYYDYSAPAVQRLIDKVRAAKPATPEALAKAIIWSINSSVTDDPDAESGVVVSKSASEVLASGKAVCQGYSALFVALARGLGLPARTIVGDYVDEKAAETHAWVEVALDGLHWTPVEPQNIMTLGLGRRGYLPFAVERLFEAQSRDSTSNDAALRDDPLLTTFDVHGITKILSN